MTYKLGKVYVVTFRKGWGETRMTTTLTALDYPSAVKARDEVMLTGKWDSAEITDKLKPIRGAAKPKSKKKRKKCQSLFLVDDDTLKLSS